MRCGRPRVEAELQSYEVPVDFLIETEPFTAANGLLSGVGKILRPRLKEHYGERLEQLYAELAAARVDELRALRENAANRSVLESVTRAARPCWARRTSRSTPTPTSPTSAATRCRR